MGSLFSKDKKQKTEERKSVGSAPSRLEGLDGTTPPASEVPIKRALTPDTATRQKDLGVSPVAVSAGADTPSPASTSPSEEQRPKLVVPPITVDEPASEPTTFVEKVEQPAEQQVDEEPASEQRADEQQQQTQQQEEEADEQQQRKQEQEEPEPDQQTPELQSAASATPQDASTPTRRAPKKMDYVGVQSDGTKLAADLPAAVQVPDEAAAWMAVLGESIVRNLHSPDWKTREHALQAVMRSLGNARWNAERSPEDVWNTVTQLLDKSLKDKVAPLYYASLELLSTLVASYSLHLPFSVLTQGLEPLIPTLLHRVGNNNARIQETSIQALLTLANQPALGLAYLAPHALSSIPKKSQQGSAAASQMAGRLELITCMLNVQVQQQLGFGTAGRVPPGVTPAPNAGDALSAEDIVRFTRPALDMPDDKVRTAAVRLVAEVYRTRKAAGQPFEVEKLLGAGVKPALLQVLHRRFAEVDEDIAAGGGATAGGRGAGAEDVPVGTGITIKASPAGPPSAGGKGNALPPISGRFGTLPALAVVGSRGGSRTPPGPTGTPPMSAGGAPADPAGKPPRTPLTPGSAPGGSRGRTPPRSTRMGTPDGNGIRVPSPHRGASPLRNGGCHADPAGLLPGSLPDSDMGSDVMMIHSGTSTPVRGSSSQSARGNSSQSVRNGSSQSSRNNNSLKPRSRGSGGSGPSCNALDDAEEQLIEYILNDEARAAA